MDWFSFKGIKNQKVFSNHGIYFLGANHILVAILHSVFLYDMSGLLGISSKFFSEGVHNAIKSVNDSKALAAAVITKSQSDTALVMAASGMLISKTVEGLGTF